MVLKKLLADLISLSISVFHFPERDLRECQEEAPAACCARRHRAPRSRACAAAGDGRALTRGLGVRAVSSNSMVIGPGTRVPPALHNSGIWSDRRAVARNLAEVQTRCSAWGAREHAGRSGHAADPPPS